MSRWGPNERNLRTGAALVWGECPWSLSIASGWKIDRDRRSSLLAGKYFPVPERREFTRQDPRLGFGRATSPTADIRFAVFPCIFPVDQGFAHRDEFATDCPHRHLVCVVGDGDAGTRVGRPKPRGCAGFWARALAKPNRRLCVTGLECAAVGICLCCQVRRFGAWPRVGAAGDPA